MAIAPLTGQRVLIFGDSLSHRGSSSAPVQINVTEGSNRTSSVPGDLLASYLLENGASGARLNAKISRSAHNFFRIENAQALFDADRAWYPTIVIVVLGTNDLGLNMAVDAVSMIKIRDAFRAMNADVWAIGPPSFQAAKYMNNTPAVVEMMKSVFGENRFIDARPLTNDLTANGRSSDGVHFNASGARLFAQRMAAAFLSKISNKSQALPSLPTNIPQTQPPSTIHTVWNPLVTGVGVGLIALIALGTGYFVYKLTRPKI